MTKTNTLLFGPIGSGKSYAARTLLAEYPNQQGRMVKGAGKEVFALTHEPGWRSSYKGLTCELGFHVCEHLPTPVDWELARDWVDKLGKMASSSDMIKQVVPISIRQAFQRYIELFDICINYKCDVCGKEFGCVDDWTSDRVLYEDGLTGLTELAIQFINGPKPFLPLESYQAVMALIKNFVQKCAAIQGASYVLVAHWDREVNEVTREKTITIETIGQRLAPRLIRLFDEIVLCQHEAGRKFWWSTVEHGVELKARTLPYSDHIDPDFRQLFE